MILFLTVCICEWLGIGALTRAALGRGVNITPSRFSRYLKKTTPGIDAKISVPYLASIWRLLLISSFNPSRNFWENGLLVTSCSAIWGQKAVNDWRLIECWYRFKVKRKPKTTKDVNLSALQNGCLGFLILFDFDPPKLKFWLLKNKCL